MYFDLGHQCFHFPVWQYFTVCRGRRVNELLAARCPHVILILADPFLLPLRGRDIPAHTAQVEKMWDLRELVHFPKMCWISKITIAGPFLPRVQTGPCKLNWPLWATVIRCNKKGDCSESRVHYPSSSLDQTSLQDSQNHICPRPSSGEVALLMADLGTGRRGN